jgi:hypothetical protein
LAEQKTTRRAGKPTAPGMTDEDKRAARKWLRERHMAVRPGPRPAVIEGVFAIVEAWSSAQHDHVMRVLASEQFPYRVAHTEFVAAKRAGDHGVHRWHIAEP